MQQESFTLLDDGRSTDVTVRITGDGVRLAPDALRSALGLELKPEGLCKGATCFPVRDHQALANDAGVDLSACAEVLSRPLAMDIRERVAYLGVSATDRSAQLASLEAPNFTLPDLTGKLHSLSDYRGRKVLLIAHASW